MVSGDRLNLCDVHVVPFMTAAHGFLLHETRQKIEKLNKEKETLINIFSEERVRRDREEENLRKKRKYASNAIQELLDKIKLLEKMKTPSTRPQL